MVGFEEDVRVGKRMGCPVTGLIYGLECSMQL